MYDYVSLSARLTGGVGATRGGIYETLKQRLPQYEVGMVKSGDLEYVLVSIRAPRLPDGSPKTWTRKLSVVVRPSCGLVRCRAMRYPDFWFHPSKRGHAEYSGFALHVRATRPIVVSGR